MAKKTFYDVLQVSRNADPEIIKAAYKSLVQRYQPDKNPDNPDAEKNLKIINRAYEVLSDPVKRAGYDAALAEDDEDRINQADAATSSNESEKSQTASRVGNDAHINKATERAAPFDQSTTLTKKRDYLAMLDLLPMAATADFFKSLVLTGFHGSPEASGWAVFFSMLLGGAVGYPLCHYARTKITKNVQNRRTVIFLSLSISLGLTLAILTTNVLLTKSASRSAQNSVVPKNMNPLDDPNFGADLVLPYEKRAWSGNSSDQFDSVEDIERQARKHDPRLNDPRAWDAVRAWQLWHMREQKANVALYMAVDTVLEGLKENKGICRPGNISTVDVAHADNVFPAGTVLVQIDCDQ